VLALESMLIRGGGNSWRECMGLILEARLEKDYPSAGRHVGVYLPIPKKFLSEPFSLRSLIHYDVEGEILDIRKFLGELEKEELKLREVIGSKVKFILVRILVGTYDCLYISETSWPLFRDYGILPGDYVLKVKLTHIKVGKNVVEIYPKRDVVVR
jgi:hypothetical protein